MGIKLGHINILETGTVTVTSAATGYPAYRLYDRFLGRVWKATSTATQVITVDQGATGALQVDALVIPAGHNLNGCVCHFEFSADNFAADIQEAAAAWTQVGNGLIYVPAYTVSGSNLVTNGTFETNISGWTEINAAVTAIVAGGVGGTNCVRITAGASTNPGIYQDFTVIPGSSYWVSGYTLLGTEATMGFYITDLTHGGATLRSETWEATAAWQRYAFMVTIPAGCISMRVMPYVSAAGGSGLLGYWDSVEVYLAAAGPVAATRYWRMRIVGASAAPEVGEVMFTRLNAFASVEPTGVKSPKRYNVARSESLAGVTNYLKRGIVRRNYEFSLPYMTAADWAILDAFLTGWDGSKPFVFVDWDGNALFAELTAEPTVEHLPGLFKTSGLALQEVL